MAQKESNVRMGDIAQQHIDNAKKLEHSIWILAQQKTELTTQLPPLIQTEIEARTEANRQSPQHHVKPETPKTKPV